MGLSSAALTLRIALLPAAIATAAVLVYFHRRRRRANRGQLTIVATLPTEVCDRPWYKQVVVTETPTGDINTTVRGLHLGSAQNPPESLVQLQWRGGEWTPVAGALLKDYAAFALLPFALLPDRGFASDSRACLIGLAGGSLLHAWLHCVLGGDSCRIDAVELDPAVLRAARAHLGLSCCERTGRVALHAIDGAAFLGAAEDECYDVLMIDLDMGSLLSREGPRPARTLYRVMSERGVCIVNEYSEDAVHERLGSVLRNVRALREYFAEVHVLRTTSHNVMYVATVERVELDGAAGASPFQRLCAAADAIRFVGGLELDLGHRLRQVPENRYTRYS